MWLPYVGMLVPFRPEWWPPMTGQVAQSAPEYSEYSLEMEKESERMKKDGYILNSSEIQTNMTEVDFLLSRLKEASNCQPLKKTYISHSEYFSAIDEIKDECRQVLRILAENNDPENDLEMYLEKPSWIYENRDYSYNYSGLYIFSSDIIVSTYNPIENRNLFEKFSNLGVQETPNTDEVLEFIHKYGLLLHNSNNPYLGHGAKETFPLDAFFLYAREAFLIRRLFVALKDKDINNIKNAFNNFYQLPLGEEIFEEIFFDVDRMIDKKSFIDYEKQRADFYHSKGNNPPRNFEIPSDIEEFKVKLPKDFLEILKSSMPKMPTQPNLERYTWDQYFDIASEKTLLDMASKLICHITNIRISGISFFAFSSPDKLNIDKYGFKGGWESSSLLSSIWLLFYLSMTGQHESQYRICPECGEELRPKSSASDQNPNNLLSYKVRKNQIFHEGCRQAYHNRINRTIKNMREEGKTVPDIAFQLFLTEDEVKKKLNKK